MEQYIHAHSQASFSHGICPECYPRYTERLTQEVAVYKARFRP